MDFHSHIHHHHYPQGDAPPPWAVEQGRKLDLVLALLGRIIRQEESTQMKLSDIQAKADDTLAKVQADTDVSNAIKTVVTHQNDLLAGLKQQVVDAQSSNDPTALQKLADTIDAIRAAETSNAQSVADAVTAGTPAADPAPASGDQSQPNPAPAADTSGTAGSGTQQS